MAILSEVPAGADVLDLGAARAARAEVRAESGKGSVFVKLAAGFVEVRAEFSLQTAFDFKSEDIKAGLAGLLVDPADVDALLADGLTAQDLEEITKLVSGVTLGE